jgi:hypothetical protein
VDAREAHDHLVTEPVQRVVGAGRRHALDRQLRPLRMLLRDEPADERAVDVQLVRCIFAPGALFSPLTADDPRLLRVSVA